jgi:hypothetical protein
VWSDKRKSIYFNGEKNEAYVFLTFVIFRFLNLHMTQSQSMPGLVFCAFHSCYTGNHEARLFQKLPEQKGLAEGMAQVVE